VKHRIRYPYKGYKREIEYRGYRAYYNEFGMWVLYSYQKPYAFDRLEDLKAEIDKRKENV